VYYTLLSAVLLVFTGGEYVLRVTESVFYFVKLQFVIWLLS
jgi:hypothetical protein